jgi:hypothetical protein
VAFVRNRVIHVVPTAGGEARQLVAGILPSWTAATLVNGGGAGPSGTDRAAPRATRLAFTLRVRKPVTFRFRVSEAGRVRVRVNRLVGGVPRRLVRQVGRAVRSGPVAVALGRLPSWRYRLTLRLTDAAGNVRTVTRAFTVPRA